jgi:polysaccharide biosynthesis transport protein
MNERHQRTAKTPGDQPPGFNLADVYFTLFRHWRLIALSALLSVAAAGYVYKTKPPVYTSEAKLLVRFVVEEREVSPSAKGAVVTSTDSGAQSVMNSEKEILESFDLALTVADAVGPGRILGRLGESTNRQAAARVVRKATTIDIPNLSKIIRIGFSHRDKGLVQPVLTSLVEAYQSKHIAVHGNKGAIDENFRRQLEELRVALAQTEAELKQVRTNLGIVSIEESKKSAVERLNRINEQLMTAEGELAEARAVSGEPPAKTSTPNARAETNEVVLPPTVVEEYSALRAEVDSLRKKQRELLVDYTRDHPSVKRLQTQLAEKEAQRKELERRFPRLAELPVIAPAGAGPERGAMSEATHIAMLQAKIASLNSNLEKAQKAAVELADAEIRINELQRTRELQETNYRHYKARLDATMANDTIGPGKVTGITAVQEPSAPTKDFKPLKKPLLAALLGPLVAGLGLAFLLDMFLDQTVKRASDVERKVNVPLFVSIPEDPQLNVKPSRQALGADRLLAEKAGLEAGRKGTDDPVATLPAVLQQGDQLQPFFDTLRDRLFHFFEIHEMTHKPKLVAVTGCHKEAGASTVAAGLAASLSETGEGNVLLVDMNSEGGTARHFFQGKPRLSLLDVLDDGRKAEAQVQDKLYVVEECDLKAEVPRGIPKRFYQLMPRLKLSDYDYIIFDMPEMSQTSITPRVGRFMDMVLLVAEAEKTNAERLRQATELLTESGANVGAVLNRVRNHVPQRLRSGL